MVLDTAANCTTAGERHKECTVCKEVIVSETVAKLEHQSSDWIIDSEATYETAGSKHKECTVCHITLETESIPAQKHSYGEWVITKKATCLEEGEKQRTCSECGDVEKQKIAKAAHTSSDWIVDEAATCTVNGSEHKECTVCNEILESTTIPLLEHNFDCIIYKEPDFENSGLIEGDCRNCNFIKSLSIPALKNADGSVNDFYSYYKTGASCIEGSYVEIYSFTKDGISGEIRINLPKTNHIVNENEIEIGETYYIDDPKYGGNFIVLGGIKNLTCSSKGTAGIFTCDMCNEKFGVILKKHHQEFNVGENVKINEIVATCVEDGSFDYTCNDCGELVHVAVKNSGHDYKVTAILPATAENIYGGYSSVCSRCNLEICSWFKNTPATIYHEATCYKPAYIKYIDINFCVEDVEHPALGHYYLDRNDIKEGGLYDVRDDRYATAFERLGTISCGNTSVTNPGDGFWTCDRKGCNVKVPVKLYKSHISSNGSVKNVEATCEKKGEIFIDKCLDCNFSGKISIPALGHSYAFSIAEVDVNGVALKIAEICERCGDTHYHNVVSYIVKRTPTCLQTGLAEIKYFDDNQTERSITVVLPKKEEHTLNGRVMVCDYRQPYLIDEVIDSIYFIGGYPKCSDCFTENSNPNAIFKCDQCGDYFAIFVKEEHYYENGRCSNCGKSEE